VTQAQALTGAQREPRAQPCLAPTVRARATARLLPRAEAERGIVNKASPSALLAEPHKTQLPVAGITHHRARADPGPAEQMAMRRGCRTSVFRLLGREEVRQVPP
jgi:hypothetical protein